MKKQLLILFISIWTIIPIFPQPSCNIKQYSIDDGLSHGVIMSIVQDRKGYMWMATWNGLNKFDGYIFQTFKATPGDGCTLHNNRIEYIVNGKYDWIWCRTYGYKAYLFNPDTQKFIDILESIPSQYTRVRRINALKKGVVWLICDKGYCYRIDETQYKDTTCPPQQYSISNKNLKGKTIYNILQDSDTDEWILTNQGVTIVGKKKIFSSLPFRYMQEINKEIWLASENGQLGKYNKQTGKVSLIPLPFSSITISTIKNIRKNLLTIGTKEHGLILYDTSKKTFKTIDIRTTQQTSNEIQSIYVDKHNEVWMSTPSKGVVKWNSHKDELSYLPPLPYKHADAKYNSFYFIFEDCNGHLWIHPKGGNLSFYDREHNKLCYFHNDPHTNTPLLNTSIHSYFTDSQGNLWLNTSDRNLCKIDFLHIPYTISNWKAETRAFLQVNNQLWIASKDKKIRIYGTNGELSGYLNANGQIVPIETTFSDQIYCMSQIKDGSIWLGSKFNGLYVLKPNITNPNKYDIYHYKNDSSDSYSLSHNDIYSIYQNSQGHIWIGCFGGGINLVKDITDKNLKFININNELKNYPSNNLKVRCISEISNGTLIAGTTKGLVCFSSDYKFPEEIHFHTHIRNPQDASSLSNNNVINIYTTPTKETYIATLGGGINKLISKNPAPDNLVFKSYTQQSGMTSDWVLFSISDANNNLWIISENTLSKFNPDTETFDNYDRKLLKHAYYYSEAVPFIDSHGILWLGTNEGTIRFPITQLHKSEFVPPIVLTNIKIPNNSTHSSTNLSEISLKSTQRNLTIEFAALDYVDPENICYAYKLEGLESDWNYVGKKRSASYINLPPGT